MNRKRTFLICPVRGCSPQQTQAYVDDLERQGWEVHWPPRDTQQNDPNGLQICKENDAKGLGPADH